MTFRKHRIFAAIPAALLVFVLIALLAVTLTGPIAEAEETKFAATEQSEITFAQMSDIHYFPYQHCYPHDMADYLESDFYHSTTGDTKLVIESGSLLMAHIEEIIADAHNGVAPMYLFTTGDLCKNGEQAALIDVANALRYLQNEVRKVNGYENFQVFATVGNHDLYNASGKLYDMTDGSEYISEVVTSAQFALIFTGLGFPDIPVSTLYSVYPAEYWSSSFTAGLDGANDYGYVASETAANLEITYYSDYLEALKSGFSYTDYTALFDAAKINSLSHYVDVNNDFGFFLLDGTDRENDGSFTPVRVNEQEYGEIEAVSYHLGTEDGKINSASASDSAVRAAFAAGKPVYANTGWNHITGGRLTEELLDWMRAITSDSANAGKTFVAAYHFNALPHFEQEDDILKDFVFYNWEYITEEFLEMGIRYGLSGHMHSSDIAYYNDAAGRTFYDVETGSTVSYASARRYMSLTRYELADGEVGEKFTSSLIELESFDFDGETVTDPNAYITEKVYGQLVDRVVDHFIDVRTIEDMLDFESLLGDMYDTANIGIAIENLVDFVMYDLYENGVYPDGNTYDSLLDYVNDCVAEKLIRMKFGAAGQELTLAQIFSFIMMAHAQGVEPTTAELLADAPAISGTASERLDPLDPVWRARYIAALQDFDAKCDSGQLAEDLFGILLDALWYDDDSILKTLLSAEINLRELGLDTNNLLVKAVINVLRKPSTIASLFTRLNLGLDAETLAMIEEAIPEDLVIDINEERLVLVEVVDALWPVLTALLDSMLGLRLSGDNLYEGVNALADAYLTESFYVGLSGIAKNIVVAYATDDEPDVADIYDLAEEFVVVPHEGYADEYEVTLSYVSDTPVADEYNAATQENGRLPSHLTASFAQGDESGEAYTLNFYTAEKIGAEVVLLDENGNEIDTVTVTTADLDASADDKFRTVTVNGESGKIQVDGRTYAQYIPLIDLGILTISHTEIEYEKEPEEDSDDPVVTRPYTYLDRDKAPANSVVYRNRWTVTFKGLEAGKTYGYEVRGVYGAGENISTYGLAESTGAERFTFTTLPSETTDSFTFLAFSDLQGMIESMYDKTAATLAAAKAGAGEFDFVLNAGDMADNGDNFSQWGWALNGSLDLFANTSTILAAGNHEDGGGQLARYYNYTSFAPDGQDEDPNNYYSYESGMYYSFNYGTAHIVVLNTNLTDNATGLSEAQIEWLKSDLKANADAQWKFVLMHKSLYSAGSHSYDGDIAAMRRQLVPLFYEYGVDVVFGGHDHTYTVTQLLDGEGNPTGTTLGKDGVLSASEDGVLYVTLGTVGTKFYNYMENPDIAGAFDRENSISSTLTLPTFAKITVNGDTLTFTGYTVNEDGTLSKIYNEPGDDLLLVKILVPIAAVIVIAGVVVAVIVVRKKKKAANSGAAQDADEGAEAQPKEDGNGSDD